MKSLYKITGKKNFVNIDAWLTVFVFPVLCGWIDCCSCFTVIYCYRILSSIALHVNFECVSETISSTF